MSAEAVRARGKLAEGVCVVCGTIDADVVTLSSGLTIHPLCWPHFTSTHANVYFGQPAGWHNWR